MANISSKLPVRGVSSDIQVGVANSADVRIDPALEGGNLLDIKTAVQIMDDWDDGSDRAKVNLSAILGTAVDVNTGNASAGTQRVVLASDQPAVSTDLDFIAGTATAVNTGNANAGTQRVVLASDQPAVPVSFASGNASLINYNRGTAIAANGTSTHTYTPAANGRIYRIYISGSGQMNGEIKYGTTGAEATTAWLFATKGDLNPYIEFPQGLAITTAQSLVIVRTNDDNQAQDLYSWVIYRND